MISVISDYAIYADVSITTPVAEDDGRCPSKDLLQNWRNCDAEVLSILPMKTCMVSQTKIMLSVKSCMLVFIQTLPRISFAGALSRVSFLDLFGPIAGVTNPIM